MTERTAKTRKGKTVVLNVETETRDGWFAYVLNRRGYAVQIFVPK